MNIMKCGESYVDGKIQFPLDYSFKTHPSRSRYVISDISQAITVGNIDSEKDAHQAGTYINPRI